LERDWNPRLTEALAHVADVSYQEEIRWAQEVAAASGEWVVDGGSVELPVASVTCHPLALQRRLLRHAVRLAKGNLAGVEFAHIEGLVELGSRSGSGRRTVPGLIATRSFEWMRVGVPRAAGRLEPVPVPGPGRYGLGSGKAMTELEFSEMLRPPDGYDTLRLEFRTWRPGDQYWPAGAGRMWSVQELFQKARVPSWKRALWPILTSKGKILWVKQFGPAQDAGWLAIREIPTTGVNLSPRK
jgi:tRNA(Ile)-lysidine synthetase-like protein